MEGGATGPAETNCMSWDYKECSGKSGFDEEMKKDHQAELKQRDDMLKEWKFERQAYVLAKSNVARIEAVDKARDTVWASRRRRGEVDQAKPVAC